MTPQEIFEYNTRCAEFLKIPKLSDYKGVLWDFQRTGKKIYSIRTEELNFHRNWNSIMEVVEAIEKLNKIVIIDGVKCMITPIATSYIYYKRETKKEAVVQAINNFLIWYNENK